MGILAADFLSGCQNFAKSKRRDRLLSAQGDGQWGSTLYVRLCPASSSGVRRPPASSPRARRGHVRCPTARVVAPLASLVYLFGGRRVAVGHDEGGGRRRLGG
jgi:hypothetical protein